MARHGKTANGVARRGFGAVLGPLLFVATLVLSAPVGMAAEAWPVAGLAAWMAVWWITEAIPLAATALLPVAVVPLAGAGDIGAVTAPFANPLIFLFLGGFALALAIERCALHRRLALAVLARVGDRPGGILAGFMAATALISMWVSNSATALMMVPIAVTVADLLRGRDAGERFAPALLLGVGYAASLGGMATLVGTPPNAALAAFAEQTFGRPIGFLAWMAVGMPVAVVLTALTWLILRIGFGGAPIAGAGERLRAAAAALGPWRPAERRVAAIALVTALLWIGGPLLAGPAPGLGDSGVAVAAAVVLFVIPSGEGTGRLLGATDIARLPWGILLLVGGGLSLAGAMEASGLAQWLGQALGGLAGLPPLAAVAVIVLATVLFSELASNTATATALLPVVAAIAAGIGVEPLTLAVPMALAASCGFMLPVATPPNAIAYATGKVSVGQMARAGFAVDAAGIAVVTLLGYTLVGLVFTG